MKYMPPVTISFSSLNHLTVKGAVPVKAVLKQTVAPGMTSWLSGFCVNAGGSGCHQQSKDSFHVSMILHHSCTQHDKIRQTQMTFDIKCAAGVFKSS